MKDQTLRPARPKRDLKRGRWVDATPAGNSPEQIENLALETGRDYFGPSASLELDETYGARERWSNVLTGERADPRFRGSIRVYELVPDPEAAGWIQA